MFYVVLFPVAEVLVGGEKRWNVITVYIALTLNDFFASRRSEWKHWKNRKFVCDLCATKHRLNHTDQVEAVRAHAHQSRIFSFEAARKFMT